MHPKLTIQCHPKWLWKFNTLLQKGVQVPCRVNQSLMALLKEEFHLDGAYIDQRIQTITIDGQPVDDLDDVMVPDGVTLAISGAMPGLVGAILRRDGYYAAMRASISHTKGSKFIPKERTGLVTIKLFNLVLKDLAENFLSRGISVQGDVLVPLLDELWRKPVGQFGPIVADGDKLIWSAVRGDYLHQGLVFIKVLRRIS